MSIHTTCHDCQTKIPRHEAHLRSVSLRQVAFCDGCWNLRIAVDAVFANVPAGLVHAAVSGERMSA